MWVAYTNLRVINTQMIKMHTDAKQEQQTGWVHYHMSFAGLGQCSPPEWPLDKFSESVRKDPAYLTYMQSISCKMPG